MIEGDNAVRRIHAKDFIVVCLGLMIVNIVVRTRVVVEGLLLLQVAMIHCKKDMLFKVRVTRGFCFHLNLCVCTGLNLRVSYLRGIYICANTRVSIIHAVCSQSSRLSSHLLVCIPKVKSISLCNSQSHPADGIFCWCWCCI